MVTAKHPQQTAQASAAKANTQKNCLRDPLFLFSGIMLVYKHKRKRGSIDYNQIEDELLHCKHLSGGNEMKKLCLLLVSVLLLSGCGKQTFETVNDDLAVPVIAQAAKIQLDFPEAISASLLEGDDDSRLYLCEGFSVAVQTLAGGDMEKTVETVTGFEKDMLNLLKTQENGVAKYFCAWSTAGEGEDQICRTLILDDGAYHYAVTIMADYSLAGESAQVWQTVLDSVHLSTD